MCVLLRVWLPLSGCSAGPPIGSASVNEHNVLANRPSPLPGRGRWTESAGA